MSIAVVRYPWTLQQTINDHCSMSIYTSIYYNLCHRNVHKKETWVPGSGLHRHHIVPKHTGGSDDESNFTYLTVREHIISHLLLWKIHNNPNDLRAMHMLGAELTPVQRKITGKFCRDNKIGFHGASKKEKLEWSNRGRETMKKEGKGMYGFTFEQRSEWNEKYKLNRTHKTNKDWQYWMSKEGRKKRSKMGAQALIGRKCVYLPGELTYKRILPSEVDSYLSNGYLLGWPFSIINGKRPRKISSEIES